MAVHVLYNCLFISLPSSAKQQCEITEFGIVCRMMDNILKFYSKFIVVSQIKFCYSCDSGKQSKFL